MGAAAGSGPGMGALFWCDAAG